MSGMLDWLIGPSLGIALDPEAMRQANHAAAQHQMAMLMQNVGAFRDGLSAWQRGETRAPGFYWTRTGPRTHRVEIVR